MLIPTVNEAKTSWRASDSEHLYVHAIIMWKAEWSVPVSSYSSYHPPATHPTPRLSGDKAYRLVNSKEVANWDSMWVTGVQLDHLVSSISQFSPSVVSDSLRPHESQHARPPCPSPTPGVYSNSCPSSRWCHPAISFSVVPFFSCPQSLPASGSFPISQLFAWGGQSIGVSASASVLPMNTQDWSPLGWTVWISLQSKELSRVFSSTIVQKHQFFGTQLSSQSNAHQSLYQIQAKSVVIFHLLSQFLRQSEPQRRISSENTRQVKSGLDWGKKDESIWIREGSRLPWFPNLSKHTIPLGQW